MTEKYVALVQISPPDGGFQVWGDSSGSIGSLESRIGILIQYALMQQKDKPFSWAVAKIECEGALTRY